MGNFSQIIITVKIITSHYTFVLSFLCLFFPFPGCCWAPLSPPVPTSTHANPIPSSWVAFPHPIHPSPPSPPPSIPSIPPRLGARIRNIICQGYSHPGRLQGFSHGPRHRIHLGDVREVLYGGARD